MVSKYIKGKPWYDVAAVILVGLFAVAIFLAILHGLYPGSGLTRAIHSVGQEMAAIFRLVAQFFTMIANWFASW